MLDAVVTGLPPHRGRAEADHAMKYAGKYAGDRRFAENIALAQAFARDPAIASGITGNAICRLTNPENYLSATEDYIDRVMAAARGSGAPQALSQERPQALSQERLPPAPDSVMLGTHACVTR